MLAATLFDVEVTTECAATAICETEESPLLLAREAGACALADHADRPITVAEIEGGGFLVQGAKHAALLIGAHADVQALPDDSEDDEEVVNPDWKEVAKIILGESEGETDEFRAFLAAIMAGSAPCGAVLGDDEKRARQAMIDAVSVAKAVGSDPGAPLMESTVDLSKTAGKEEILPGLFWVVRKVGSFRYGSLVHHSGAVIWTGESRALKSPRRVRDFARKTMKPVDWSQDQAALAKNTRAHQLKLAFVDAIKLTAAGSYDVTESIDEAKDDNSVAKIELPGGVVLTVWVPKAKEPAEEQSWWRRYTLMEAESPNVEFTNRYDALGMGLPDPKTMCAGECDGTGLVPIHVEAEDKREGVVKCADPETIDDTEEPWRSLWIAAEEENPSDNGWHFVKCPDCKGTGKADGRAKVDESSMPTTSTTTNVNSGSVVMTELTLSATAAKMLGVGESIDSKSIAKRLLDESTERTAEAFSYRAYLRSVVNGTTSDHLLAMTGQKGEGVERAQEVLAEAVEEAARDVTVTVWSRFPGKTWLVERSYALHFVQDSLGLKREGEVKKNKGREFAWFPKGVDPNTKESVDEANYAVLGPCATVAYKGNEDQARAWARDKGGSRKGYVVSYLPGTKVGESADQKTYKADAHAKKAYADRKRTKPPGFAHGKSEEAKYRCSKCKFYEGAESGNCVQFNYSVKASDTCEAFKARGSSEDLDEKDKTFKGFTLREEGGLVSVYKDSELQMMAIGDNAMAKAKAWIRRAVKEQ